MPLPLDHEIFNTFFLDWNRSGVALTKVNTIPSFLKEGLTIAGWVAMWRPLEIYLYEWWPLRRLGQVFNKLSRMPVEVRKRV